MARQKSELKSAFGKGQEILFALLEGVEDAGGSDEDARRIVTDKKLQRQVAELLVSRQSLTAHVRYDDPGHHTLNPDEYYHVEGSLTEQDFPVRGTGEADVTYEYVEFDHDPTTHEVLDTIERRGLRVLDFAETRDFHTQNPRERKKGWIVSLCGQVSGREGRPGVADVGADENGLNLRWRWLGNRWDRSNRFLAVRKDT